ncbi:MAG: MaoC family dehydratase [Anaerolineae bacterium]
MRIIQRQKEQAPEVPVRLDAVRRPRYGRFLEEFEPGAVFRHPRGLTIFPEFALAFATTFMQANPLYLNEPYARAHGFARMPVSPMMTLNLALSLGVQNDSEQAIAHLGYYDVVFPRPFYIGDTIRSETRVLSRRVRGPGKPGVVRMRTRGFNEQGEIVVQYDRAILIPAGDEDALAQLPATFAIDAPVAPAHELRLPDFTPRPLPLRTGGDTCFEDFKIGEIILHGNGRTVTDEHIAWTYRLGNTHPLHYDRVYSHGRQGPMSGEPIVYGGLVFAWLEGLASRDTSENALWDLGYTEGYHTQPVVAGDTLYAVSRVLAKEDVGDGSGAGVVTLQLIGVKNVTSAEALQKHGQALFHKESGKPRPERIRDKVFEIERRLLIKRRAAWEEMGKGDGISRFGS